MNTPLRSDEEMIAAIQKIRDEQGSDLTILGHHYQSDAVVGLSDFTGDSFKLCRDAAQATARYIVFCGVRFMAESARVLARPEQIVQHPEVTAGCPMADMADISQVERAWKILSRVQPGKTIIPVTYMNSNVDLKAFCGRNGGTVCTSSNAGKVFDWAYKRGQTILFFPDEHLGRNTANAFGIARDQIQTWDPARSSEHADDPSMADARIVVWKGFCPIHMKFSLAQIEGIRRQHSDAFVIVHPECTEEIVAAADAAASTEGIIRKVAEMPAGRTVAIGTEIHLVRRLAKNNPQLNIVPLVASPCPNMIKITLERLLTTVQNLGRHNVVTVDSYEAADAAKALRQMLEIV